MVSSSDGKSFQINKYICMYISIYIYVSVRVCVCMSMRVLFEDSAWHYFAWCFIAQLVRTSMWIKEGLGFKSQLCHSF